MKKNLQDRDPASKAEFSIFKINRMFSFLFAPNFLSHTRSTALACCVLRHLEEKKVLPCLRRRAPVRGSCGEVGPERNGDAAGGSKPTQQTYRSAVAFGAQTQRTGNRATGEIRTRNKSASTLRLRMCLGVCTHARVFYVNPPPPLQTRNCGVWF